MTLTGAGALGLLFAAETATALWVVLLGLGQGACFSLALTFFALRAPDSEHAAALSGMAQSVGYLLAAVGPFLFGLLRDATHAWPRTRRGPGDERSPGPQRRRRVAEVPSGRTPRRWR